MAKQNEAIISRLTVPVDVPGEIFRLNFGWRHPSSGMGAGRHGVDSQDVVDWNLDAVQRAQQWFLDAGWEPPTPGPGGRVEIYLCDVSVLPIPAPSTVPIERVDTSDVYSEVFLRCGSADPHRNIWRGAAQVDAAHEVSHTFLHRILSPRARHAKGREKWGWLDEATASYLEHVIFPEHAEALRWAHGWTTRPERALASLAKGEGYFAAGFVAYLVSRTELDVLRLLWLQAAPTQGVVEPPLAVLERIVQERLGVGLRDFMWDYFCDSQQPDFVDAAHQIYGRRTTTARLTSLPDRCAPVPIAPLGCRYFEVDLGEAQEATVRVLANSGVAPNELRVAYLVADEQGRLSDSAATPLRALDEEHQTFKAVLTNAQRGCLVVGRVEPEPRRGHSNDPLCGAMVELLFEGARPTQPPEETVFVQPPAGIRDVTEYRFEDQAGASLTIQPLGDDASPTQAAEEYLSDLPDEMEPRVERRASGATTVSARFEREGGAPFLIETAFFHAADGMPTMARVTAAEGHPSAHRWLDDLMQGQQVRPRAPAGLPTHPTRGVASVGGVRFRVPEGLKGPEAQMLVSDEGVHVTIRPASSPEARARALDDGMRFPVDVDVQAPPAAAEHVEKVRQAVLRQLTLKQFGSD